MHAKDWLITGDERRDMRAGLKYLEQLIELLPRRQEDPIDGSMYLYGLAAGRNESAAVAGFLHDVTKALKEAYCEGEVPRTGSPASDPIPPVLSHSDPSTNLDDPIALLPQEIEVLAAIAGRYEEFWTIHRIHLANKLRAWGLASKGEGLVLRNRIASHGLTERGAKWFEMIT